MNQITFQSRDDFLKFAIIQSLNTSGDRTVCDILSDFGFCKINSVMTRYEGLVDKIVGTVRKEKESESEQVDMSMISVCEDVSSCVVPSLIQKDDVIVTELTNSIKVRDKAIVVNGAVSVKTSEFDAVLNVPHKVSSDVDNVGGQSCYDKKLVSEVVVENFSQIMKQQEAQRNERKLKKMRSNPNARLLLLDARKASWNLRNNAIKYKFYENIDGFKCTENQNGNFIGLFELTHSGASNLNSQIFLVGRDVCAEAKNDRPALDLVMTRTLATGLGYTDVFTEIVMIPLLRISQDKTTFYPGMYSSVLGSIQRRTANLSEGGYFNKLSNIIYEKYYIQNESFESIVRNTVFGHVENYLDSCFMDLVIEGMRETQPLNSLNLVKSQTSHKINMDDEKTNKWFSEFDENSARMIQTCVNKCKVSECGSKGLMYGSRVNKRSGLFILPCGDTINDIKSYYLHPCAVRGKAVQFNSKESVCNDDVNKELLYGTKCSCCFRVYSERSDAVLCSIFCHHVGNISTSSYRMKHFGPMSSVRSVFDRTVLTGLSYDKDKNETIDAKRVTVKKINFDNN